MKEDVVGHTLRPKYGLTVKYGNSIGERHSFVE
jgi:hypothetical protein